MNDTSKRPPWFLLTRHWVSLVGLALLATAVISWLFVLPQQIRGHVDNPYVGIVVFLLPPVIFFAGLALIPIGIYLSKREIRKGLAEPTFDRKTALAADAKRQTIPWIEYRNKEKGEVRHFVTPEAPPDSPTALRQFEMECVDCHNRPTHTFDLPERAMDIALISRTIQIFTQDGSKTSREQARQS